MKKVPIWMLGIAMMLASCSQGEELLQTDASENDEVRVTFSVQTPEIRTRATVPSEEDESKATRYICEVYEGSDASNLPTDCKRIEQEDAKFSLLLKKNTDYVFLLWADCGTAAEDTEEDNYYDATSLQNVQVAGGATKDKCDEIAFYACQAVNVTSTGTIADITLHHAVAKVCLYETNIIQKSSTLNVEYTPAQSFNVAWGRVTSAAENNTLTFSLDNGADGSGEIDSETEKSTGINIARFYVLASEKGKPEGLETMTFTLTETATTGGDPKTTQNTINNVPLQANYVTNIRGGFSDYTSATFSVTVNNQWEEGEDISFVNVDMANFSSEDAFRSFIADLQGYTLKFSGNITNDHMAWFKNVFDGGYSTTPLYVLDMSEATLTDGFPAQAFYPGDKITGIILPNNLEELPAEALYTTYNCKFIQFPASLKSIGQGLLNSCEKLEEVCLDETQITEIPDDTFYRCFKVKKIALGNITKIGYSAFHSNKELKELDLSKCTQVPTINRQAFMGNMSVTNITTVYVKDAELQAAFQSSDWVTQVGFRPEQFVVKQ